MRNKSLIILQREYMTRVRKKSFVILTLLVPFLLAAFTVFPAWLARQGSKEERTIAVCDESGLFREQLESTEFTSFQFLPAKDFPAHKSNLEESPFYALLYIPADIAENNRAEIFSGRQIPIELKYQLKKNLEKILEAGKKQAVIRETGIAGLEQRLAATQTRVQLETIKVSEEGTEVSSSSEMAMIAGYAAGFIIYLFVFIYGTMVMRGVMEEKTNRIVELIVSSVRPRQLMSGKIIGIGLVGLTQLLFWIILLFILFSGIQAFLGAEQLSPLQQSGQLMTAGMEGNTLEEITRMITGLNLPLLTVGFLFYFLGGFLLYSSLMGAIGAAVDNEEETQQLMLPVSLPLIFSIIILFPVAQNPEGPLAFWTSVIPFTSPVVMMVRIPFGVPLWELLLSMSILALSIWGTIWIAAKIYRTGILLYGKKVDYKEIFKWLTYRN